ncbi:carbamoyltransferase HypF [Pectinatus sottacetonis]|uniref:carbamoyltransferase HypF n=1 Tax=Pectinatus sottacetonis TaxID=1002795 RepID=UPI0018C7E84C|nr:carbamoyltransferase HypF [Pectinatus sottacetonis]
MIKRLAIRVKGIVQGVGFRPFIYRLAYKYGIHGFVFNDGEGVFIEAQGENAKLEQFVAVLKNELPPAAVINELIIRETQLEKDNEEFVIKKSPATKKHETYISPDLAICPDCQQEIRNKNNRRYHYPFTNCTNCGPRFSIVKDIPYDRENTTMKKFVMCEQCQKEYDDPSDRRFHAQPNACGKCGPRYELQDNTGRLITADNETMLRQAHQLIKQGQIIALKGIGGYHLVCDACNKNAVDILRHRKKRFDKALAVMAGSIQAAEKICEISRLEKNLLLSPAAPIVLLKKKKKYNLPEVIAPGTQFLGVMQPYAPIHCLLLQSDDIFVMTSANISEEPIAYLNADAQKRLCSLADYFLIHDRDINMRIDDSVIRVMEKAVFYIRRSRGFAPSPIKISNSSKEILAVGSQLKNTFCLFKNDKAFLSHHIGDLENKAANDAYKEAIIHYEKIFAIKPQIVACDMHPEYFSTKYAESLNLPLVKVQHHHAHIASVLAENNITTKVIGIALDGTGYGDDGCLWGGEFFICDCKEYKRAGHFSYIPLPGGSMAIKEPWRPAVYVMDTLYGKNAQKQKCGLWGVTPANWQLAVQIARKNFNSPLSSSAGRLFDIAAAILGIRGKINYEGQAAVELEQIAAKSSGKILPYDIKHDNGMYVLDFLPVFKCLVENNRNIAEKAADFHVTMAVAIKEMTERLKELTGINKIVLSGGVCQNKVLLELILELLQTEFIIYINRKVPANDGGLSFGQAAVAANIINDI